MNQNGNALFIVLLGVVMFAALSYAVMRQESGSSAVNQLSDDQAELYASELINHANAVKQAIALMLDTGSTIDDINFVKPGEAGYDTLPHIHKVFHPGGGGISPMNEKQEFFNETANRGWESLNSITVAWTPSTNNDIVYSFIDVDEKICEDINLKINGLGNVVLSDVAFSNSLIEGGTDVDITTANCASCEGYASLCIDDSTNTTYGFYTIVAAR